MKTKIITLEGVGSSGENPLFTVRKKISLPINPNYIGITMNLHSSIAEILKSARKRRTKNGSFPGNHCLGKIKSFFVSDKGFRHELNKKAAELKSALVKLLVGCIKQAKENFFRVSSWCEPRLDYFRQKLSRWTHRAIDKARQINSEQMLVLANILPNLVSIFMGLGPIMVFIQTNWFVQLRQRHRHNSGESSDGESACGRDSFRYPFSTIFGEFEMNSEQKPQYWVVGASWGGHPHQDKRFVENSMWMLGWKVGHQPKMANKMQPGDRIAIKRMTGRGQSEISILHIGIIRGVILDTNNITCTVDWVATGLDRRVDAKGCLGSVHGPFPHDEWVEKVFCL